LHSRVLHGKDSTVEEQQEDPEFDRLIDFWIKNRAQLAFMCNVDEIFLTDDGIIGYKKVLKKGEVKVIKKIINPKDINV